MEEVNTICGTNVSHDLCSQENVALVKARLQEEGREARNLIAYSLPLRKRKNISASVNEKISTVLQQTKQGKKLSIGASHFKQPNRLRSASAGRDPQASLRARHWGFLFRNLEQAVDEIYETAEQDESIIECKEAIMMLERYASDFYKLIEWLNIKWKYENTSAPNRPTSLAWEIRTSSPWKGKKNGKIKASAKSSRKIIQFEPSLIKNIANVNLGSVKKSTKPLASNVDSKIDCKQDELKANSSDINLPSKEGIKGNASNNNSENIKMSTKIMTSVSACELDTQKSNSATDAIGSLPVDTNGKIRMEKSLEKVSEIMPSKSNKLNNVEPEKKRESKHLQNFVNALSERRSSFPLEGKSILLHLTKDDDKEQLVDKSTLKNEKETCSQMLRTVKMSGEENLGNKQRTKTLPKSNDFNAKKFSAVPQNASLRLVKNPCSKNSNKGIGKSSYNVQMLNAPKRNKQKMSINQEYGLSSKMDSTENQRKLPMSVQFVRSATTLESRDIDKHSEKNSGSSLKTSGRCCSSSSLTSTVPKPNSCVVSQSWADRVRGSVVSMDSKSSSNTEIAFAQEDDGEGWEIVRRHKRNHLNSSSSSSNGMGHANADSKGNKSAGNKAFRNNQSGTPVPALSLPSLLTAKDGTKFSFNRVANQKQASQHSSQPVKKKNNTCGHSSSVTGSNANRSQSVSLKNASSNGKASVKSTEKALHSDSGKSKLVSPIGNSVKNSSILKTSKFTSGQRNAGSYNALDSISVNPTNLSSTVSSGQEEILPVVHNVTSTVGSEQEDVLSVVHNVTSTIGSEQEDVLPVVHNVTSTIGSEQEDALPVVHNVTTIGSEQEDVLPVVHNVTTTVGSEQEDALPIPNHDALTGTNNSSSAHVSSHELVCSDTFDPNEVNHPEPQSPLSPSVLDGSEEIDEFFGFDSGQSTFSSLSWADQMDAIDLIKAVRPPGRVLHIHEKLSSPSRKLPLSEKHRRHEEKLAKAQQLRGQLMQAKTEKLKGLFKKIDEVNTDKERLLIEKRGQFERKMERAEENRRSHLQEIVNKAHDEENKAKEIAFINDLEAQNKRHDIRQQHQSHESRLADMVEERTRRHEEKAAKEAAAQERRRVLETERQARMLELWERRCRRFEHIDRRQAEKREELQEQAREKAREREERLTALQQAQQAKEIELERKIQQKLEETAKRHDQNIQLIRRKAVESSIMSYSTGSDEAPQLKRYETKKLCTICDAVISSEVYLLSHLRSRSHQLALNDWHKADVSREESGSFNLKFIVDAPADIDEHKAMKEEERRKNLKKRLKKIRTRMAAHGKTFLNSYALPETPECPMKRKLSKNLSQIDRLFSQNWSSGPWSPGDASVLDRNLLDILRTLQKGERNEVDNLLSLDGLKRLMVVMQNTSYSSFESLRNTGVTNNNNNSNINSHSCNSDKSSQQKAKNKKDGNNNGSSSCVIPDRSISTCLKIFIVSAKFSTEVTSFLLEANFLASFVDHLVFRLQNLLEDPEEHPNIIWQLPSDSVVICLMELMSLTVMSLSDSTRLQEKSNFSLKLQDVVSYCVSLGVPDKICDLFNRLQTPVDEESVTGEAIVGVLAFLSSLAKAVACLNSKDDRTQLVACLDALDACGVVSLLYGLLLHQGGRSSSPPPQNALPSLAVEIAVSATSFLLRLAELNLHMFQLVLGSEGISLEFRHIASFLFWYCSFWPCEELLHNIVRLVGYFSVNHKENQSIIQSGETPSVLQQLCSLPWQYFSEDRLRNILFPSLLACCYGNEDNLNVLTQEMSYQILEDYLEANIKNEKCLLLPLILAAREESPAVLSVT